MKVLKIPTKHDAAKVFADRALSGTRDSISATFGWPEPRILRVADLFCALYRARLPMTATRLL